MLRLLLLLAGLRGCPAPRPGYQNSFLQIILPEKIKANTSNNSEVQYEQISYIIPIYETLYTVHLKKRYFLADNFIIYLYHQGTLASHSSNIQPHCYYQGYVEGYPNSIVTLSTCSGLRGILQFENVSYGIEPLESIVQFRHLLYKLGNDNMEFSSSNNTKSTRKHPVKYNIYIDEKPEPPVPDIFLLYVEMHIVVGKALYEYLGSDSIIVTNKIIKIIGLVNSMFTQFKVTVVLLSLELWSDKNKVSTVGEADELLQIFATWKQSYPNLRPHDVAYLFIYRDYPDYVGAVFPAKICNTRYSAGIAVYHKRITLEAFSVVVSQMLALSLGISYDDPKKCHCSEAICIMNPEAMTSSGAKTFSNCSLSDFKSLISNEGASCLQNKPQMQRKRIVCGNGKVEGTEFCDCGTAEFRGVDHLCRPRLHPECDLPEYCNGSSAECPVDITLHNGVPCKNNETVCYEGNCPDLDIFCESVFGKGSKNAPFVCYEEMNAHADRYGNCGKWRTSHRSCTWRSLGCGRLICIYPFQTPFYQENGTVVYASVEDNLCVTISYGLIEVPVDPLLIPNGAVCDKERVCVNAECTETRFMRNHSYHCGLQCHGHGAELDRERERDRGKGLPFVGSPPKWLLRQAHSADPKPGARCFLLVSHAGAGLKHLGHHPLPSRATAETWTGRGATGTESGAPTKTGCRRHRWRISLVSRGTSLIVFFRYFSVSINIIM
ncbi:disintegrin and metalloproteinase domain-containing protein 32 isoform X4 [Oryctolagus cuniculus]|uniref:disintegrin and metalloproteinase domain-containing protein 32 isoform X4 n=1 Tax=Oryctolagus cuniculus TaxID=9986 RepID=UPI00387925BE